VIQGLLIPGGALRFSEQQAGFAERGQLPVGVVARISGGIHGCFSLSSEGRQLVTQQQGQFDELGLARAWRR
jgi:hypothetical protein